jgi:LacI family transcriptional regulator
MPAARSTIALILPTAWVYGADIARSVIADTQRHPGWSYHLLRDRPTGRAEMSRWLAAHPADGAIVLPRFSGCVPIVARAVVATVAVCDRPRPGIPHVGVDDRAIGRCAGEHLRAVGVRTLAFLRNREPWSAERARGLREAAGGLPVVEHPALADPGVPSRRLGAWLASLAAPVGLFAGNDLCAGAAAQSCGLVGLEIPDRVRVVGADDDPLLCLAERPAISSVRVPWAEVGRRAALALAALLAGRQPQPHELLAPLGVAARASTDPGGSADQLIARAQALMAVRVPGGLNAAELAAGLRVSSSTLERRMRGALGHGPLEAIRRIRLNLATDLLQDAEPTLTAVAARAGYPSLPAMHAAFRQRFGIGPAAWRRLLLARR